MNQQLRYSQPISENQFLNEKTVPFQFPEEPNFNNPITAIESNIYGYFNFILKDGSRSTQDTKKEPVEDKHIP